MNAKFQRGLLFVLFVAVVGGLGLGYCAVAYKNALKDGALIGLVGAVAAAFVKFMGSK